MDVKDGVLCQSLRSLEIGRSARAVVCDWSHDCRTGYEDQSHTPYVSHQQSLRRVVNKS